MKRKRYKRKRRVMNLYRVTNGFMGYGAVHVYVIAENENRAKELAALEFKEEARNEEYEAELKLYKQRGWCTDHLKKYNYDESYWTRLDVELVAEDTTQEFVSGAMD
ncbi:TPA: hypothetical protein ACOQ31_004652 [Bacillus cereus]|uniref:GIY-YIG nuclease family protein n=1 Tax=Sphingobacterium tenebrionis TaxID=3111775 RepID=A0ABU8I9P7_9SPHI|nr:hypothetical protein [Bacillus cereus]MBL3768285.1 hypothetical protein [Bacillus cereus]MBL3774264.1 hypothetical protein [Bacillus cereus]MBL3780051.1 hypothetical protein [Bacillus cereus]MBL3791189.1 hypothetical protein [Bacillus cereus]HDR4393167.1 hypothetical protein [Bacillus cereus]